MTIIEARGGEFVLSDIYPTVEVFKGILGNLYLHQFFPISPTKAIVLNHIAFRKDIDKSDPVFKEIWQLVQIIFRFRPVQKQLRHQHMKDLYGRTRIASLRRKHIDNLCDIMFSRHLG